MYLSTSVLLGLSVLAAFAIAKPVNQHLSPAIRSSDWCGIHVTQYQKNEPSGHQPNSSVYVLEVCIYDGAQVLMSSPPLSKSSPCWIVDASNGIANIIPVSRLSDFVYVIVGTVDDDPILFSYGDQHWGSNDQAHHSNFGGYEGGKREGDTGFSCQGVLWGR